MAKQEDFVYFVHLRPNKAAYTLAPYSDEKGDIQAIYDSKNADGSLKAFNVTFTKAKRQFRVHKDKKDINGINIADWLRNHPRCEDSVNLSGTPYFKEVNSGKDASIALEADKKVFKAKGLIYGLTEEGVIKLSDVLGFKGDQGVRLHKLIETASYNPDLILEKIESPALDAEASFNKALEKGVITKKGFMFYWKDNHLGNSRDEVVRKLMAEEELLKSIKKSK